MTGPFEAGGPGRRKGIDVAEADRLLGSVGLEFPVAEVALRDAAGRILAEDVRSDRPVPPFDRVCMDGYAIPDGGSRTFRVAGSARAGEPPKRLEGDGNCLEAMTGAVAPVGTFAVVPVEKVERRGDEIRLLGDIPRSGANIHALGRDRPAGAVVVRSGSRIGPAEIGAMASVGAVSPRVRAPRVVVVSSGDELVAPEREPLPHQVRQSNAWALRAALAGAGFPGDVFHLADDPAAMAVEIERILDRSEVVVLSGGVSMGRWDLLPGVLERLGVERLFHGVAQQPGMPLWMGVRAGRLVAGLPGNPVSAQVCLARHVLPLLERACGLDRPMREVLLETGPGPASPRTRFLPVELSGGVARIRPLTGSGDWAGLAGTDGFVEIPAGRELTSGSCRWFPW